MNLAHWQLNEFHEITHPKITPAYWEIFEAEYSDIHTPKAPCRHAMGSGWWEINETQIQPLLINHYEYWRFEMCKMYQHADTAHNIMIWNNTPDPKKLIPQTTTLGDTDERILDDI